MPLDWTRAMRHARTCFCRGGRIASHRRSMRVSTSSSPQHIIPRAGRMEPYVHGPQAARSLASLVFLARWASRARPEAKCPSTRAGDNGLRRVEKTGFQLVFYSGGASLRRPRPNTSLGKKRSFPHPPSPFFGFACIAACSHPDIPHGTVSLHCPGCCTARIEAARRAGRLV